MENLISAFCAEHPVVVAEFINAYGYDLPPTENSIAVIAQNHGAPFLDELSELIDLYGSDAGANSFLGVLFAGIAKRRAARRAAKNAGGLPVGLASPAYLDGQVDQFGDPVVGPSAEPRSRRSVGQWFKDFFTGGGMQAVGGLIQAGGKPQQQQPPMMIQPVTQPQAREQTKPNVLLIVAIALLGLTALGGLILMIVKMAGAKSARQAV